MNNRRWSIAEPAGNASPPTPAPAGLNKRLHISVSCRIMPLKTTLPPACPFERHIIADHFADVGKMVELGSSAAEYLTFVVTSGQGGGPDADENIWLTQKMSAYEVKI